MMPFTRLCLGMIDGIVFFLLLISPMVWILHDGLGPNAVESSGWHAIHRTFTAFYWGPITVGLIMMSLLGHIKPRLIRK